MLIKSTFYYLVYKNKLDINFLLFLKNTKSFDYFIPLQFRQYIFSLLNKLNI